MAKKAVRRKTDAVIDERPPNDSTKMIIADSGLAFAVYVLYLLGYFTGITALIGVIIAYSRAPSANSVMKTHYTFQIRTFWIGLIYLVVGALLLHFAVGVLILLWWLVWSLVRSVGGLLALNRNGPIANPESLMFGD